MLWLRIGPRKVLQKALIEFGGSVTFSRELVYLDQSDGRVVVGTSDGHESAYDIVIGADGINSKVRENLGIEYLGFDLPETWSIADVGAQNWPNAGVFTACLLGGGRVVVVVPLEAERFRVISNTEDALAILPLKMNVITKHREGKFKTLDSASISLRHRSSISCW